MWRRKASVPVSPALNKTIAKAASRGGLEIDAKRMVKTKIFSISSVMLFRLENIPLRKF
jgi:hypothetical protein